MILVVDESFKKDFKNLKNREIQDRIMHCLDVLEYADSLAEIPNLKKMRGFTGYYRIRVGDFRIGFSYDATRIVLLRVRSRKDIYRIFP